MFIASSRFSTTSVSLIYAGTLATVKHILIGRHSGHINNVATKKDSRKAQPVQICGKAPNLPLRKIKNLYLNICSSKMSSKLSGETLKECIQGVHMQRLNKKIILFLLVHAYFKNIYN